MAATHMSQSYDKLNVKQLNMQHSKRATNLLSGFLQQQQTSNQKTIFLIQEPYIDYNSNKIKGLQSQHYNLFHGQTLDKKRTCIVASRELAITLLPQYSDGDLTSVLLSTGKHGQNEEIILCSGYMPHEKSELPSETTKNVIEYASDAGIPIVLGCDTNAHHTIWGSSNINMRGNSLLEYIASTNLDILNRGTEPTFVISNRSEVLDVTFVSQFFSERIANWHVSPEETLSDHRGINFNILMEKYATVLYRNPRNTNWDTFRNSLREKYTQPTQSKYSNTDDLDAAVENLTNALTTAFFDSCPGRRRIPRKNHWWNKELTTQKKLCRSLYRTYRNSSAEQKAASWKSYKKQRNKYGQNIADSKESSWRRFCGEIEERERLLEFIEF